MSNTELLFSNTELLFSNTELTSLLEHGTSLLEHGTCCVEHGTCCVEHGTFCVDHGTSCVEHGTSGVEHGISCRRARGFFVRAQNLFDRARNLFERARNLFDLAWGFSCEHRACLKPSCARAKNLVHFSICACHPCAGAMLIFSVSFQFYRIFPEGNPWIHEKRQPQAWRLGASRWSLSVGVAVGASASLVVSALEAFASETPSGGLGDGVQRSSSCLA